MEHGKVTSVEYRDGVVYCTVRPMRSASEYDPMPVMKTHSGFIQVPKVGEVVAMQQLDDGTRFISDVLGKVAGRPKEMSQGDLAIQLDEGTKVQLSKRDDGKYDLHLEASGDVFIDGFNFDEHVHETEDSTINDTGDGSGTESTTTKTTTPPK